MAMTLRLGSIVQTGCLGGREIKNGVFFVAESCFCGNVMWYGSRVSRVP